MAKTLVFDVDGVLADFCYGFSDLAIRRFHQPFIAPYSNGGQPSWEWSHYPGIPHDVISAMWAFIQESEIFWYDLLPLTPRGEIEDMRVTCRQFNVAYMTARPGDTAKQQTEDWLTEYGFPSGQVIIQADKPKGCHRLQGAGAEIVGIIDDRPRTLVDLYEDGWPVTIRDAQYNRTDTADVSAQRRLSLREMDRVGLRVTSLAEFLGRIRQADADGELGS